MTHIDNLYPPEPGYYWCIDLDAIANWLHNNPGYGYNPNHPEVYVDFFSTDALSEIGAWKQRPYLIHEDEL